MNKFFATIGLLPTLCTAIAGPTFDAWQERYHNANHEQSYLLLSDMVSAANALSDTDSDKLRLLNFAAHNYFAHRDQDGAKQIFQKSIEMPGNEFFVADAHRMLARIAEEQVPATIDEALFHYRAMCAITAPSGEFPHALFYSRGMSGQIQMLIASGDQAGALEISLEALKSDSLSDEQRWEFLASVARLYRNLGNISASAKYYEKAVAEHPDTLSHFGGPINLAYEHATLFDLRSADRASCFKDHLANPLLSNSPFAVKLKTGLLQSPSERRNNREDLNRLAEALMAEFHTVIPHLLADDISDFQHLDDEIKAVSHRLLRDNWIEAGFSLADYYANSDLVLATHLADESLALNPQNLRWQQRRDLFERLQVERRTVTNSEINRDRGRQP